MQKLWMDFETVWAEDYTLKKQTPIEYVQDPRFEALGCGFSANGKRWWVDGPDLPRQFQMIDWKNTMVVSHNALFDMLILSFRYGIVPGMYGDTLSMARNWIVHSTGSVSLDSCAKYYGLPPKWTTVNKTKGVNFVMLKADPILHREVAAYAIDDTIKCETIYNNMIADGFPEEQLEVIDMVIRMVTEPRFKLDANVLAEHLAKIQADKAALLARCQLDNRDNLLSDPAFATMLLYAGVNPPTKVSKATGKDAFAFAKTDKAFTALLEHENPDVQALVAARLGHKSTLEETRTQRLMDIAAVVDHMPVPLKYSGAHTHRFSGDWHINLQNLPRQGSKGDQLRKALVAPEGHVVVSIDASQIEARLNATLSGQWDLVDQFRLGEDVYASFAEEIYHHPVNKHTHKIERFVGKTSILSLGYGSSPPVFQNMCRVQGDVILTDAEATSIVFMYRAKYKAIVDNWKHADKVILPMIAGSSEHGYANIGGPFASPTDPQWRAWGPVGITEKALTLPSGNLLRYRDLHHEYSEKFNTFRWTFMRGTMPHSIYGAKLVENVIQALSFIHIMEVALRVKHLTQGLLLPAHQVHDELIYIVKAELAEQVKQLVVREMSKAPSWMPRAPLAAEGHIGRTYFDAKG
jgi:DNA polymerase I-like protein with 3'-5' exonuclease and polymerase domains